MKRTMKMMLALGLVLGLGEAAWAQVTSSDSLTVTIRPNVYYAVVIDTGNVNLDLGYVDMGQSTWTLRPATVTIESTYATTDLELDVVISCGGCGTPWQIDEDSTTLDADRIAGWVVFTDTGMASVPDQTGEYFDGTAPGAASDMLDNTQGAYVDVGNATTRFEADTEANFKDMNNLPPIAVDQGAGSAHMWMRFRAPGASTEDGSVAQFITITLGAKAAP